MFLIKKLPAMALVSLLAGTAAWIIVRFTEYSSATSGFLPLSALVGTTVLILVAARPVLAAILILCFAFVNQSLLPILVEIGQFSIRYIDIFFGLLAIAVGIRIAIKSQAFAFREFGEIFLPLVPFLIYIGATLANVGYHLPNFFAASAASYLRLIVTALFALLLYLSLRSKQDLKIFNRFLIGISLAAVGTGAWEAWSGFGMSGESASLGRVGGLLGINSLGLVSGLLILYAFLRKEGKGNITVWGIPLTVGLLGLFLTKSASSIYATAGALAVHIIGLPLKRRSAESFVQRAVIVAVPFIAATIAISIWREIEILGFIDITEGSFSERLMIAYAGLLIFYDHPLLGVGWQASATEYFIASPTLNAVLMAKFPELPFHYFFLSRTSSLHNMYIQILAELGIVGFGLFVYTCLHIGKTIAKIVRSIPAGSPYKIWARFSALGLLFLLIWWNTNPLYGGQTESILAFTFIATLAAAARLERQRSAMGSSGILTKGRTD